MKYSSGLGYQSTNSRLAPNEIAEHFMIVYQNNYHAIIHIFRTYALHFNLNKWNRLYLASFNSKGKGFEI